MDISRRDVLRAGIGAAALTVTGANMIAQTKTAAAQETKTARKEIPVGLQLYSLRDDAPKDVPGVLAKIAQFGYEGVEFAGYYGKTAEELRKLLDASKLRCCGTHTGIETLEGDELKKTVEFNKTLGNKFLIVPSLPAARLASAEAVTETAKLFTEIAGKVAGQGLHVGYHAHAGDFRDIDGRTAWDLFFSKSGPQVVMQLDTANCLAGGGDPVAILKKFPGRSLTVHIKEHGGSKEKPVLGEGAVPWREVFATCESIGGTEWYIIEQEVYPTTPLESVRMCIENYRKLRKAQ
jgi:sugar phosphate isomerase/epimerase